MKAENLSKVIILNDGLYTSEPQIIFPFFRPISIYELDDENDYEELIQEINSDLTDEAIKDDMILLVSLFKDSLEEKNAEPIFNYFLFNYEEDTIDFDQIHDVVEVLNDFIERITDEDRPMH